MKEKSNRVVAGLSRATHFKIELNSREPLLLLLQGSQIKEQVLLPYIVIHYSYQFEGKL